MLMWIIKLAEQGCFASTMQLVGMSLFGEDWSLAMRGPDTAAAGHKLSIEVHEADGTHPSEVVICASCTFALCMADDEMTKVGELPLKLKMRAMIDEDGAMIGFLVSLRVIYKLPG